MIARLDAIVERMKREDGEAGQNKFCSSRSNIANQSVYWLRGSRIPYVTTQQIS